VPATRRSLSAIDDATRLAYVEVLADEQKATTVMGLPGPCRPDGFPETGDHLSPGSSRQRPAPIARMTWRKPCRALDLKPIRTKHLHPQTQRQGRTFIKPMLVGIGPM